MSTVNQPIARGVREEAALHQLRPALADAIASNRPVAVQHLPRPLHQQELAELAVRLCRNEGVNAAVLPAPGYGVLFVPV
jgi:hypothetical protein